MIDGDHVMMIKHVSMVENVSEIQLRIRPNQHVVKDYKKKYVLYKIRQTTIVNAKQGSLVIGVKRLTLVIP